MNSLTIARYVLAVWVYKHTDYGITIEYVYYDWPFVCLLCWVMRVFYVIVMPTGGYAHFYCEQLFENVSQSMRSLVFFL